MLINSKGFTKTIVRHNNNKPDINEVKWDANYDGSVANVSLNINDNGKMVHKDFHLTNENIADIFTIPSVSGTLDERLLQDFTTKMSPSLVKNKLRKTTTTTTNKKRKKKRKGGRGRTQRQ